MSLPLHVSTSHREIPAVTYIEECDFTEVDRSLLIALVLRATALGLGVLVSFGLGAVLAADKPYQGVTLNLASQNDQFAAVLAQVAPVHQLGDGALDHAASRKFRISCGPRGVSTDSGWNWTPWTGSSRWRTAMISPSSAVAATSSTSGTRVAASEW